MNNKQQKVPFSAQLFAGAIAGVSEISIMYPLDGITCLFSWLVVKTRMQLEKGHGNKKSIVGTLRQIVLTEG